MSGCGARFEGFDDHHAAAASGTRIWSWHADAPNLPKGPAKGHGNAVDIDAITYPEAEIAWLQAEVYGRAAEVPVHEITALTRFSERVWQIGR
jgi:hypothetical protein